MTEVCDWSLDTASHLAFSNHRYFWENNSLSELTTEERETYARIDSLVAEADTSAREGERGISMSALPGIDFNRVAGITLVGNVSLDIGSWADVGLSAAYGFAIKRPFGEANATIWLARERDASLSIAGSIFSRLGVNHWDKSIPRIVNTVTAGLFHRDYYDWFRHDGWTAEIAGALFGIGATAGLEMARHLAVPRSNTRSVFVNAPLRDNPMILNGSFTVWSGSISYGRADDAIVISSGSRAVAGAKISTVAGTSSLRTNAFNATEVKLSLEVPTFGTGYVPMSFRMSAHGGMGSDDLPLEYQFRMRTAASIVAPFGHFISAPIAAHGGTRYLAFHAEHNFSDIVWRWLGLPTYWGRGLEFIVSGAAGQYTHPLEPLGKLPPGPYPESDSLYKPTHGDWYTEVGFGLGKIPTFISNVAFLRVDARAGIGPLARGKWGVVLSLSSPF